MVMKVDEVVRKYENKKHEAIIIRVLKYLQEHPDEVFRYDGEDLQKAFPNDKIESLNYSLWRLEKDKKISKYKISPKVAYFGSNEAIDNLKKKLYS
jgi:hypothetical protein